MCPECKDAGTITLLRGVVPCKMCRVKTKSMIAGGWKNFPPNSGVVGMTYTISSEPSPIRFIQFGRLTVESSAGPADIFRDCCIPPIFPNCKRTEISFSMNANGTELDYRMVDEPIFPPGWTNPEPEICPCGPPPVAPNPNCISLRQYDHQHPLHPLT